MPWMPIPWCESRVMVRAYSALRTVVRTLFRLRTATGARPAWTTRRSAVATFPCSRALGVEPSTSLALPAPTLSSPRPVWSAETLHQPSQEFGKLDGDSAIKTQTLILSRLCLRPAPGIFERRLGVSGIKRKRAAGACSPVLQRVPRRVELNARDFT